MERLFLAFQLPIIKKCTMTQRKHSFGPRKDRIQAARGQGVAIRILECVLQCYILCTFSHGNNFLVIPLCEMLLTSFCSFQFNLVCVLDLLSVDNSLSTSRHYLKLDLFVILVVMYWTEFFGGK